MGVIRKQTYLTEEQDRAIKQLANAEGISEAEIVRRAVDAYLEAHGLRDEGDPYLALVALGASEGGDGSVNHDAIYERV